MIGKYSPKLPTSSKNVNAPDTSPLRDFFILVCGLGIAVFSVYLFLGILLEIVLRRYEVEAHNYLAEVFKPEISADEEAALPRAKLQQLVDELAEFLPPPKRPYHVHLIEEPTVNALAFPGGHILVYRGLLQSVKSENELSMVLAHELGHYAGQDHLQGLGRSLALFFVSVALTGQESYVSSLFGDLSKSTQGSFSRKQELEADAFALSILNKKYGHVAGATDFFHRISEAEQTLLYQLLNSTHPLSSARVEALERIARENDFKKGESTPLPLSLLLPK